ncbi:MAG: hypothetical protein R3246_03825 [Acidimicrobiia bacterium]|nr:hypothetical protein [Acidimicrobiia bacterium]
MPYEAVEHIEHRDRPGQPPELRILTTAEVEDDAIAVARTARDAFLSEGRLDYAWWIVRQPGETLARWIADSSSTKEFVLDLRSGELVEY